MSDINPYSPSEHVASQRPTANGRRVSRLVRVAIYLHLAAVAGTGLAMTHDSRTVIWSEHWEPLLEISLVLGELLLLVCPVLALVGIVRSRVPSSWRLILLAVEAAIVGAHIFALLPAVQ